MDFNSYQKQALVTAVYPADQALAYLALGLSGEAAEVANKVKKIIRGDYDNEPQSAEDVLYMISKELGDVLWYVAVLADELGVEFNEVAISNLAKLHNRELNGTLKGSGDER